MLTEHAAWDKLLGLPLDSALAIARSWGVTPTIVTTTAPRRRDDADAAPHSTLRVIRVKAGELTVSAFMDGDPHQN